MVGEELLRVRRGGQHDGLAPSTTACGASSPCTLEQEPRGGVSGTTGLVCHSHKPGGPGGVPPNLTFLFSLKARSMCFKKPHLSSGFLWKRASDGAKRTVPHLGGLLF